MPRAQTNGIELEYETFGPEAGETLLLINGLGRQLTAWFEPICVNLAERGYRVVRFDNRDVGLSWRPSEPFSLGAFNAARREGRPVDPPYTLEQMAADAVGLLDHLGVRRAHVAGVSMGGMIAQLLAADYPDRVLSLTSIMSSSGAPHLPAATPEANAVLYAPPPDPDDPEAVAQTAIGVSRAIGSPGYPTEEAVIRARAVGDAKRGWNPPGSGRQLAAILHSGDRREKLRRITAPTVVLHGQQDALVPIEAGRDTAANIPGAELIEVPGMGHDLPEALFPKVVEAILRAAARAGADRAA